MILNLIKDWANEIYLFGFILFLILNKHYKTPYTLNYDMKVFYFWVGINLYNFIYTQFKNFVCNVNLHFFPKYCIIALL